MKYKSGDLILSRTVGGHFVISTVRGTEFRERELCYYLVNQEHSQYNQISHNWSWWPVDIADKLTEPVTERTLVKARLNGMPIEMFNKWMIKIQ